jgi:hypothetical protein
LGLWGLAAEPGPGQEALDQPGAELEGVWSNLKRSLANLAKRNIDQLTALIKTRLTRTQHRPELIEGFLANTGLDLTSCNPSN